MISQTFPKATIDEDRIRLDAALARVLDSGRYILGGEVSHFEQRFAGFIGARHGIGVATGTDALEIALRALGIGAGDLVATVSHTATATVTAIHAAGARPVFVDLADNSFLMDLDGLDALAARKPIKALVAVHLYGQMLDPERLTDICRRHGWRLIEDCAQAHGATWNGRRAGSFGDAAAFSFYPTKNLGGLGDGGMLLTQDSDTAARARLLREYGWQERFVSALHGKNSRLDPIQAALLDVLLDRLDERNQRRRALASSYDQLLVDTPVVTPAEGFSHVYHQYVIRVPERDALAAYLQKRGIGTAVHYPVPVHRQPAYADLTEPLPRTDAAVREILSLPMYPQLRPDQAQQAADLISQFHFQKS